MKKYLLLLGLTMGLNYGLMAQNVDLSKTELEQVLCQRWEIEYAQMGGMKITQKIGAADFDLKFFPDGEYEMLKEDENNTSGEWTYNSDNKYIELSIKDKVTSRIISIDKNKLILKPIAGENDPPGLPSVEVHFKSI